MVKFETMKREQLRPKMVQIETKKQTFFETVKKRTFYAKII